MRAALAEGPIPFATLRERLDAPADELAEGLVQGFDAGAIAFRVVPSPAATVAGSHPRASALARSQATPGSLVTTLHNQVVRITDEPTGALLRLLDGTRDRAAILAAFPGALRAVARRRAGEVRGAGAAVPGRANVNGACRGGFGVSVAGVCSFDPNYSRPTQHTRPQERRGTPHPPSMRSSQFRALAPRPDQLVEVLEVGLERQPALLAELLRDRPDQVAHRDRALLVGGLERRRQ